ncbi:Calcium-binding protein 39-like [Dermatophagoides pteronyssinus]|uniref:Calcium-binding protein 39-like n=1 Tax=Dermatophagoides pteronyssinus TaxID=6956 RepID=A0ABQ8J0F7_DERPT|nr:Calcium-binding protein 39-like [Dermatophagoides pteronyssinus]
MILNDNDDFIRYRRPQQIISLIRTEIFATLSHETDAIAKAKHLDKLEKLIEQFRINLCGNFHRQPWKENQNDFRLEREFISQNMLGYFIFNLDRFERPIIAENYVKIFVHIITKYAYGTRRPYLEKLENKSPLLLKRLLYFLATDPDNSIFAAKMLCCCCRQLKALALKLIDFQTSDSTSSPSSSSTTTTATTMFTSSSMPVYIRLLQSLINNNDFNHTVQIVKVFNELLLTNVEVSIYATNRDLHSLIETFNQIFSSDKANYYVRLSMIKLFGQLIQNRHLQKLIQTYTISLDNFNLIYELMKKADKENRNVEFTKLFEIIRLFIMNPVNVEENNSMKKVFIDEYNLLTKFIGKAQSIRSYTDIALFTPEYSDVMDKLNRIRNPDNPPDKTFRSEMSVKSLGSCL